MIVRCDKCNTRYKLDDASIPGEGIKVRCSKCGNIFIVEKPVPEDVPHVEQPMPGGVHEEAAAPEPPAPEKTTTGTDTGGTAAIPDDKDYDTYFDMSADKDSGVSESTPDEGGDRGIAGIESPVSVESPVGSEGPAGLEDLAGREGPSGPEDLAGHEDTDRQEGPSGQEALAGTGEWMPVTEKRSQRPERPERTETLEVDETPRLAATGRNRQSTSFVAPRTFETGPAAGIAGGRPTISNRTVYVPGTSTRVIKNIVMPIIILMALAAGGYAGYTYREQILAKSHDIYGEAARTVASYRHAHIGVAIGNSRGYFYKNIRQQQLFIIDGDVTNTSGQSLSFIKLTATIMDGSGSVIASRDFYAGNTLTDDELQGDTSDQISSLLDNEMGRSLQNFNVTPGGSEPFMVVFFDAPDNVASFSVTPLSAHQGLK